MKRIKAPRRLQVTADGDGVVGHAGTVLLPELADRSGLTAALSAVLAPHFPRIRQHDPGHVLRDLAVTIADGGDCLSDLCAVRDQPELFGAVASCSTAWRLIDRLQHVDLGELDAARAAARRRVWTWGVQPQRLILDLDATLVTAHSDKEHATPTWKRGFGFHPILCTLDATNELLSARLRPGNATANNAADNLEVLDAALLQLLTRAAAEPVLVRGDSAMATHAFIAGCRERELRFSVGFDLTASVRDAVLQIPGTAWRPAISQDGDGRDGADVAELTDRLDLRAWPSGTRAICRREIPHPGAQLTFTDADGYRF